MNYIELIRKFWQCNNERPIGPNATALYFYLLNINNSLGWKESFKHSDRYISMQLGISVNSVRTAKNTLKQLALIQWESPKKASRGLEGATIYSFRTVSTVNTVPDTVPDTVVGTVVNTVPDTRTKLNHTKLTINKNTPVSPKGEFEQLEETEIQNSVKNEKENTSGSRALPKRKNRESFVKPSMEEIRDYCKKRNNKVSATKFFDYYESNGWKVGKNPMKNWQAAIRTWEQNSFEQKERMPESESKLVQNLRTANSLAKEIEDGTL